MTETKLKPCPFCGGEAFLTKNEKSGVFYVFCKECLRNGRGDIISQKAAEKWNSRTIEDALQEEVKRLREALERIVSEHPACFADADCPHNGGAGYDQGCLRCPWVIAEEVLKKEKNNDLV